MTETFHPDFGLGLKKAQRKNAGLGLEPWQTMGMELLTEKVKE
jgi:hypothetical protein